MIHPILSLKAHYQTWIADHFTLTSHARKLKEFKNMYKGQICFILGNGPSLSAADLDTLHKEGIVTFAMNRVYNIFSETEWRPTYYICQDPLIIKSKQEEISAIPAKAKFFPIELKWYEDVYIPNSHWFHRNFHALETINKYGFSNDIAKEVGVRATVTFACLQIAAYMGFSKIYLLGVDHNYRVTIDEDGNVIEDPNAADYFCKDYDKDIIDQVIHDMGHNARAYRDAKAHCEQLGTVEIFNATRGGKLEIFKRADFDQVISDYRKAKDTK